MSDVVAIASGKGGVGKSTLAAAAGLCLARRGLRVCLIDMDMGLRSLDIMLGLENRVVFDLADVAEGMCRVKQALIRHEDNPNLYLLSAAQTRGSEALSALQTGRVVAQLRERFDLILIDCPAGVGRGFRNALGAADKIVLVSTPGSVELRDAERVASLSGRMDLPAPMLALNRVRPEHMADDEAGPSAYERRLAPARLIALIPEESPLRPNGAAAIALQTAARNLAGENLPVAQVEKPGLWRRVARAIRG